LNGILYYDLLAETTVFRIFSHYPNACLNDVENDGMLFRHIDIEAEMNQIRSLFCKNPQSDFTLDRKITWILFFQKFFFVAL